MPSKPPLLLMSNHIDGVGGVERVADELARGFSRRGYDVSLMGIRPTAGERVSLAGRPYHTGFLSDEMDDPAPGGAKRGPAMIAWRQKREQRRQEAVESLRKTLGHYTEGIVICMQVWVMEHLADLGLADVMAAGTRLIGQYHSSYAAAHTTGDYRRLFRRYRDIDKFVLLTDTDARLFQQQDFNNTTAIPNPLPRFDEHPGGTRENLLVSLARYHKPKTIDHALRAWATIAPEFPEWRFELYGGGPDRADLQDLIDDLRIGASARLMGPTADVGRVLSRAKLHVLSSQYEGLPMVLAEAMSMRVPSVTYDSSPGVREIVSDNIDGFVVPKNSVDELAERLRELMTHEGLRSTMATSGVRSARRYHPDTVLDSWEQLFTRTLR